MNILNDKAMVTALDWMKQLDTKGFSKIDDEQIFMERGVPRGVSFNYWMNNSSDGRYSVCLGVDEGNPLRYYYCLLYVDFQGTTEIIRENLSDIERVLWLWDYTLTLLEEDSNGN